MKRFLYIIILVLLCINITGCKKDNEKNAVSDTNTEAQFKGVNPFENEIKTEKIINNFEFEDFSFYINPNKVTADDPYTSEEDILILQINPAQVEEFNYTIIITKKDPNYYYENFENDDSIMAKLEILDYISSQNKDNQLILESLFRTNILDLSAYGVFYEIEDFYKSICLYFVYDKNIYSFEFTDLNNHVNIQDSDGFAIFFDIITSIRNV